MQPAAHCGEHLHAVGDHREEEEAPEGEAARLGLEPGPRRQLLTSKLSRTHKARAGHHIAPAVAERPGRRRRKERRGKGQRRRRGQQRRKQQLVQRPPLACGRRLVLNAFTMSCAVSRATKTAEMAREGRGAKAGASACVLVLLRAARRAGGANEGFFIANEGFFTSRQKVTWGAGFCH